MIKDIKITMLGTSGSGKTCYMLAMYAMMSEGVNGFTLTTKDPDQDLELMDKWDNLVEGEDKNRWPSPNDEKILSYSFYFNYSLTTRLMGFEWLDYRGTVLTDTATKEDYQELQKRLSESSCIFLCISGDYLSEKPNMSVSKDVGIAKMNKLITNSGKKLPVVIIITKIDKCRDRKKSEIISDIKKLFSVIFDTDWLVMICPVTLGWGLANNLDNGLIAPENVHIPLIFAIYRDFLKEAYEAQKRLEQSQQELEKLQKRNWFAKALDKVKGVDELNPALVNVNTTKKEKDKIFAKLKLLTEELSKDEIDLYLDGEEVKIDVTF